MKMARFIYEWPPPWAGLQPVAYEWTRSQIKFGHEVVVFSARWPKAGPLVQLNGAKIFTVWRTPIQGLALLTSSFLILFRYLSWRKKETPDIIHAHGNFAFWYFIYRRLLQKFKPWSKELDIPLVVHFHNTVRGRWEKLKADKQFISPMSSLIDWPLGEMCDRLGLFLCSAAIFVSANLKEEAITYYKADPNKCFVIESGVNTDQFNKIDPEERQKSRLELGFEDTDVVILNLGIMVERKNIHMLVESLKFMPPNYKLLLVGPFPDGEYRQKINELIKANKLESRVVFVGYSPYPEIHIAYQSADIFVLPSTFEGLPKVVMEALASGIPVLASGFTINNSIPGIFYLQKPSPEEISVEVRRIFGLRPYVDTNIIRVKYSWDEKVKEAEKVYDFAKKNN